MAYGEILTAQVMGRLLEQFMKCAKNVLANEFGINLTQVDGEILEGTFCVSVFRLLQLHLLALKNKPKDVEPTGEVEQVQSVRQIDARFEERRVNILDSERVDITALQEKIKTVQQKHLLNKVKILDSEKIPPEAWASSKIIIEQMFNKRNSPT
eukprot:TRINITY_DN4764_c0_g1_i5.p2 TRINITY_DN4764_c0_g1~~TRINITY_DN4764_c0_g1_i5.p2  ORF type:complete len:154 (-),score=35.71 TRINITY_DN4764_c0_g1_i5:161-622(-)